MKYRLSEIARICGGNLTGAEHTITDVFTDSRAVTARRDLLFVAIAGRNHDGHDYVAGLYSRGVRSFIVECDMDIANYPEAGFVRVGSSVEALQGLAAHHRAGFKGTVVGITGSNGKTMVKEWAAQLMPRSVKVFRSPKSYNSQIGVPLSLLMIEGDEQVALIEAGISLPDEMGRLARIINPDIGIFTTLGDAHQENFGSTEEKLSEKTQLFAGAKTIIYNSTYPEVEAALKKGCSGARLIDARGQAEAYSAFTDRASQENAASALTLSDALGFDHAEAANRLCELQPVAMRLELREGIHNSLLINDSYNSDINSLGIALDYMKSVAGGRMQTLILSDILQSGYPEEELYGRIARLVEASQVERIVGIGERISHNSELFSTPGEFHTTTGSWLKSFTREDIADRVILIKGNRASQFEQIAHALGRQSHTTVLEIDLDAMIHNLNAHRAILDTGTKVMAMVKAAGYGNGTYELAAMLQHQGVDYLAVAFADEGVQLRESGITMPIVVLNADSDSFDLMISNGLEPEIYSLRSLRDFASAVKRYGEREMAIHIKIDTGMHRLGFMESEIDALADELATLKGYVRAGSVFSHLAASDDAGQNDFTHSQIELFDRLSSALSARLGYTPMRHIANSAGIERFPHAQFDMVRLGIGLYGIGEAGGHKLRHVSTLKTRIVQIKELDASQTVGYGRAGHLRRMSRVATIPVGYADGLDRHLGEGAWSVVARGLRVPIVGRICMDTCMIDVTGIEAQEGDTVLLFSPEAHNTVEDMARVLDTIPYEIMTSISARVKRIYTKE